MQNNQIDRARMLLGAGRQMAKNDLKMAVNGARTQQDLDEAMTILRHMAVSLIAQLAMNKALHQQHPNPLPEFLRDIDIEYRMIMGDVGGVETYRNNRGKP